MASGRNTMNAECRMQNAELKSGVQSHSAFCILHSAFVLALTVLAACSARQKPPEETIPVTVAVAQQKDIPLQIRAIGSVQPLSTVSVRAQVSGELTRV